MGVVINELSVEVTGNVVKNNNDAGNSVLRMSQEQAHEIYGTLGDFFAKNGTLDWNIQAPALTSENAGPKTKTAPGSQEALKNQIDGVKTS